MELFIHELLKFIGSNRKIGALRIGGLEKNARILMEWII